MTRPPRQRVGNTRWRPLSDRTLGLEQRLFESLFEGTPATGVVDALRAYRNDDGGFGHGLEPDTRAPASQPVDVWFGLDTLVAAGARADDLVLPACDWLATLGVPVPIMLPSIRDYPQARHAIRSAGSAPAASGSERRRA